MDKEKYLLNYREIERDSIDLNPNNPRNITEENVKNLESSISKYGLLNVFVVNSRTGNLVSGHQRISILDKEYGHKNYIIPCIEIDVPEEEEIKAMIAINNPKTMGDYDYGKLKGLIKQHGIAYHDDLFFDVNDLNLEIDDIIDDNNTDNVDDDDGLFKSIDKEQQDAHSDLKERGGYIDKGGVGTDKHTDGMGAKKEEPSDTYKGTTILHVVFESTDKRLEFLNEINVKEDCSTLGGQVIVDALKVLKSNGKEF